MKVTNVELLAAAVLTQRCSRSYPGPPSRLLGCVFSWHPLPNKRHNMAGAALPSPRWLGGKSVGFDHVFGAHHSGLARRSLRDKPSEFLRSKPAAPRVGGEAGEKERVWEMKREQPCKFC